MRRIVLSLAGLLAFVAGFGVAHASEPQAPPSPPFTELEVVEQGFQSLVGWWITMLAVTALFFPTLINPRGDLGESLRTTNVRVVLITVAAFLLFAVSVWSWFRQRDRRQPPPGGEPTAGQHQTPEPTTGGAFVPPDGTPVGLPPPVQRDVVHS